MKLVAETGSGGVVSYDGEMEQRPHILLTNDDGIRSPGLWAAASALADVGYVTVTAPREQSSGMGRSLPNTSDGAIHEEQVQVNGKTWSVFAVGGTPAQAVMHGVYEILKKKPDLVVSGINYGENVGSGVTISGTVGAALEAGALGIPALAVSLETDIVHHLSYSDEVDFSVAAQFTARLARFLLQNELPADVHALKVEVPADATIETPLEWTRISMQRYYEPVAPIRTSWSEPGKFGYRGVGNLDLEPPGTDVYALRRQRRVAVTPLSLDLTSRVDLNALGRLFDE